MNPTILEFLNKHFSQVRDFWAGLSSRRRIVLVGSAILVFGGIHAFRQHMADRAYRPLYTQLTEEEAGAAVEKLKDLQVPYRLAAGGTTILVPEPHGFTVSQNSTGFNFTGMPAGSFFRWAFDHIF